MSWISVIMATKYDPRSSCFATVLWHSKNYNIIFFRHNFCWLMASEWFGTCDSPCVWYRWLNWQKTGLPRDHHSQHICDITIEKRVIYRWFTYIYIKHVFPYLCVYCSITRGLIWKQPESIKRWPQLECSKLDFQEVSCWLRNGVPTQRQQRHD